MLSQELIIDRFITKSHLNKESLDFKFQFTKHYNNLQSL